MHLTDLPFDTIEAILCTSTTNGLPYCSVQDVASFCSTCKPFFKGELQQTCEDFILLHPCYTFTSTT